MAHPRRPCSLVRTRPQLLAVLHGVDDSVDVEGEGDDVPSAGQYRAALFEIRGTDLEPVGSVALPTPAGPLAPYRGIDVAVVARPAVRAACPPSDASAAHAIPNRDETDNERGCRMQAIRASGPANGGPGYATGATTIGPSGDVQASPVPHAPQGSRRTSSVPEERQRRFYVFFATAAFCLRPLYVAEHVLFHVVHGQYSQAMTLCQRHKRCGRAAAAGVPDARVLMSATLPSVVN